MGSFFGAGLVWQSFRDKIGIGVRGLGLGPGNEFPNPPFFKIILRACGSVILVISLWKLWVVTR